MRGGGGQATAQVSFLTSLWLHPWFFLSSLAMVGLFLAGVHSMVVQTSIIVNWTREGMLTLVWTVMTVGS